MKNRKRVKQERKERGVEKEKYKIKNLRGLGRGENGKIRNLELKNVIKYTIKKVKIY